MFYPPNVAILLVNSVFKPSPPQMKNLQYFKTWNWHLVTDILHLQSYKAPSDIQGN